jgi:signal transduction histidine kinase
MKQASRSIRARFDERIAERTRLSRDLHDTLLQTLQGSKLVADEALEHRSDVEYTRRSLEKLSEWIDQAMREGRAALNALHSSAFDNRELSERLQSALDERELSGVSEVFLTVSGTPVEMDPIMTDEISRVGYEAIRNAFLHSRATRIDVQLAYSADFTLIVRDNGRGMDSTMASRGRDGHFGLQSMRERAARIHGQFQLITAPNLGTTIELKIAGKTAFGQQGSLWSKLLSWMRGRGRSEA